MVTLSNSVVVENTPTDIDISCDSDTADGTIYWTSDPNYTAAHQQSIIDRRPPTPNHSGGMLGALSVAETINPLIGGSPQNLGWAQLIGLNPFKLHHPHRTVVCVGPDRCVLNKDGSFVYRLHPGDYTNGGVRVMHTDDLSDADYPAPRQIIEGFPVRYEFGVEEISWSSSDIHDHLYLQFKAGGEGSPPCSVHMNGTEIIFFNPGTNVAVAKTAGVNHCVVEALFSRDASGWMRFYHNGVFIAEYLGANLLDVPNPLYVSRGIYRPQWNALPYDPAEFIKIKEHYFRESNYEDFA